ncbi:MAG: hypothetical protein HQ497_15780, partial [SAR86 cluster bacterium]|nr:hypothetical protein [SAR86 cluster bacterium]
MEGMDPIQKIWWGGKYVHQCLWEVMWDNPKPIINQVHGFCFAAGMGVVSLSDLCICSEDALFGYPNVRSGGPYLAPISPYILGMKKAKELMFTGNTIDAQEAWRLGLVNKVFADASFRLDAFAYAKKLANGPTQALGRMKKNLNAGLEQSLTASLALEAQHMIASGGTDESREAIRAFMEKRPPRFDQYEPER